MSLLSRIKSDMTESLKGGDAGRRDFLRTLFAESAKVGKDAKDNTGAFSPRESTDEEVVRVLKRFAENTRETITALTERGRDTAVQTRELEIIEGYLPRQMTADELRAVVEAIVTEIGDRSPKAMGKVMAELKARHAGLYDGKQASDIVKTVLA
jgi:uncharacterized protein YqeY